MFMVDDEPQSVLQNLMPDEPDEIFAARYPVSQARDNLSEVLSVANQRRMPVLITEHNRPTTVIMSLENFAALMQDRKDLIRTLQALNEYIAGETSSLEEVLAEEIAPVAATASV